MALHAISKAILYTGLFFFALFNWTLYLIIALTSGIFFQKPTEKNKLQLALTQDQLWSLTKQPFPNYRHAFFKLRSGRKLHFITNQDPNDTSKPGDLVVLVHGFPDSSMIWRHILQDPQTPDKSVTYVCVDMPGYGGSDSFHKYDTRVLDALSEFIVGMRERYTQDTNGSTVGATYVVGHDWGCVVVLRLAAEAPGLADRFVTSNGPLIALARANGQRIVSSSLKIFKQFRTAPIKNFGLLRKSYATLKPLLTQLLLSGYIFALNLPALMVKYMGSGGHLSVVRGIIEQAHVKEKTPVNVYEAIGSLRPGPIECSSFLPASSKASQGETYGSSVAARAESAGLAWWEMCGYYRYGLSHTPWEKSLETVTDLYNLENSKSQGAGQPRRSSSASAALFAEHVKGSLRAPVTMLWGEDDLALSKALCLEGIGDYLAKDSEVIVLPHSGHWTPLETDARPAWTTILRMLLNKPHDKPAPTSVFDSVKEVYPDAQLYARR